MRNNTDNCKLKRRSTQQVYNCLNLVISKLTEIQLCWADWYTRELWIISKTHKESDIYLFNTNTDHSVRKALWGNFISGVTRMLTDIFRAHSLSLTGQGNSCTDWDTPAVNPDWDIHKHDCASPGAMTLVMPKPHGAFTFKPPHRTATWITLSRHGPLLKTPKKFHAFISWL